MIRISILAWGAAALLAAASVPAATSTEWRTSNGFRYGVAPAPAWVEAVPAAKPEAKDDGQSPIMRVLVNDKQVNRRLNRPESYFELLWQPMSQEAVRQAAQIELTFSPDYQDLILHRIEVIRDDKASDRLASARIDLSRRETGFEQGQINETVSLLGTLEDVRIGDKVRYSLSFVGENPMLDGIDHESSWLGGQFPQQFGRLRVLYPAGTKLEVRNESGAPKHRIMQTPNGVLFEAVAWNQPAIRPESSTAAWFNPRPTIQVAPQRTWADVAKWAVALFAPAPPTSPEIVKLLDQWRALPDDEAKTLAALHWVQDDIRYFARLFGEGTHRPATPDEVVKRRYGDCKDKSRLLSELLGAMGIEARPVLVSVSLNRALLEHVPSGGAFDHVIVRAKVDGRDYWLDPTVDLQRGRLSQLGFPSYGAGLEIAADQTAPKPLSPKDEINTIRIEEAVRPASETGIAEFDIDAVWRGRAAEDMRRDMSARGSETIAAEWVDRFRRLYGELSTLSEPAFHDEPKDNSVRLRLRLRGDAPWRVRDALGNAGVLPAMGVMHMLELPQEVTRHTPLAMLYPVTLEHVTHLRSPAGTRLNLPENKATIENPAFVYERKISAAKDEITLSHRFDSREDHVAAAAHPRFFQDMRQTIDLGYVQVRVDAKQSRSERERRLQNLVDDLLEKDPE